MKASMFVQASLADFHNERQHTMLLYEEQDKPVKYDPDQYFVISKIEVPKDKA